MNNDDLIGAVEFLKLLIIQFHSTMHVGYKPKSSVCLRLEKLCE